MKDFTTKNLHLDSGKAIPNISGGFSFGNRILKDKLGCDGGGKLSKDSERANSSDVYSTAAKPDGQQRLTTDSFKPASHGWASMRSLISNCRNNKMMLV